MLTYTILEQWFNAARDWLTVRRGLVNNLNVFPVPDGDTGSNMLSTIRAAAEAFDSHADTSKLGPAIMEKCVWGARGNSGVILGNFLKGIFSQLDLDAINPTRLVQALRAGLEQAYASTPEPVEGTILTVMREAVEAAETTLKTPDLSARDHIEFIRKQTLAALKETINQLEVLSDAGVIDAGACGFYYLIEAISRSLASRPLDETAEQDGYIPETGSDSPVWHAHPDARFCLEIIMKTSGETQSIIDQLGEFGISEVAINTRDLIKVHLHTDDPEPAIVFARSLSNVLDVHQENMELQQHRMLGERLSTANRTPGIIAIASGSGMHEIFKELGADIIIDGGKTMNPSVAEIMKGITALARENAIILPNNPDTYLAAEEAARQSEKNVYIARTGSMPEGIAGLMYFSPDNTASENAAAIQEGVADINWGFLTRAGRSTDSIKQNELICGCRKEIYHAGPLPEVVSALAGKLSLEDADLCTVYTGVDTDEQETADLTQELKKCTADIEIEILYGGQPNYLYLLTAE